MTDDVADEPETTYCVWFGPGREWFEAQRKILALIGADPPSPGEYPMVVRSGCSRAEAEDYVQLDSHPGHPEWHWIEAE